MEINTDACGWLLEWPDQDGGTNMSLHRTKDGAINYATSMINHWSARAIPGPEVVLYALGWSVAGEDVSACKKKSVTFEGHVNADQHGLRLRPHQRGGVSS